MLPGDCLTSPPRAPSRSSKTLLYAENKHSSGREHPVPEQALELETAGGVGEGRTLGDEGQTSVALHSRDIVDWCC